VARYPLPLPLFILRIPPHLSAPPLRPARLSVSTALARHRTDAARWLVTRHTMNMNLDAADSSTAASLSPERQSRFSCLSCRQLKRRCSRQLPYCALCVRVGRLCEYDVPAAVATRPALPAGQSNTTPHALSSTSGQLTDALSAVEPPTPSLNPNDDSVALASVFLDSIQSRGAKIAVPSNIEWHDVCNDLRATSSAEAGAIVQAFHASTHTWFPISECERTSRPALPLLMKVQYP